MVDSECTRGALCLKGALVRVEIHGCSGTLCFVGGGGGGVACLLCMDELWSLEWCLNVLQLLECYCSLVQVVRNIQVYKGQNNLSASLVLFSCVYVHIISLKTDACTMRSADSACVDILPRKLYVKLQVDSLVTLNLKISLSLSLSFNHSRMHSLLVQNTNKSYNCIKYKSLLMPVQKYDIPSWLHVNN